LKVLMQGDDNYPETSYRLKWVGGFAAYEQVKRPPDLGWI